MEAYKVKFHPKIEVPVPPEGHFVAKSHGQPIFLPNPEPGESTVEGSLYTQRQLDIVRTYARYMRKLQHVFTNTFPNEQRLRGDLIVNLN